MPAFEEAATAINTDIRLYGSDLAACENADLLIRTTFEPNTSTCTVSAYVAERDGTLGKELARRVIFTGKKEKDKDKEAKKVRPSEQPKSIVGDTTPLEGW
jgi:hypothetical protein